MGKCPDCNQWDSLVEEVVARKVAKGPQGARRGARLAQQRPEQMQRRQLGVAQLVGFLLRLLHGLDGVHGPVLHGVSRFLR